MASSPPELLRDQRRKEGDVALWAGAFPLLLFLALPLVALAFKQAPAAWLARLATPMARHALVLSLETTAVATVLAVAFGLPLAYLLARVPFRGRDLVDVLVDLPVVVPPVVAGVGLLLVFGRQGFLGSPLGPLGLRIAFTRAAVVLAQLLVAAPLFVHAARAAFVAVDPGLERAAQVHGASRLRAFLTVTLPLARPALVAGAVLAWARALSEFGATLIFAGNFPGRTQTLPLAVMSALESDLDTAVAIATLSLAVGVTALLAARLAGHRRTGAG